MVLIEKKIWPDMFETDRDLSIDYRLADFELKDGDQIRFREWDPKTEEYTGREYMKTVRRVTRHNSPTRYWTREELEKHGFYIMEFEENEKSEKERG
jgi:hypothetical protein